MRSRIAGALGMTSAEIHIKILMDINRSVIHGVDKLVHKRTTRIAALSPRMSSRPAIPRHNNQVIRARSANRVDSGLVVLQHELRCHIVRLVHEAKDNFLVILEARRKLAPELAELRRRRRGRV
ncbi:hypothetical protein RRF57_009360 [Xylaria bambusicola]|uniref:Uncharacterized protein n=1 Tax=Xylaria bambusicola TaxID=326684 RepID=A0AAN7UVE6_9PEZI